MGSASSQRLNESSIPKRSTYRIAGKQKDKEILSMPSRFKKKKKEKVTTARVLGSEALEEDQDSIYATVGEAAEDHGSPDYDVLSNGNYIGKMEGAGGYFNMPTAEEGLHSLEAHEARNDCYVPVPDIVDAEEEKAHDYTTLQWPHGHQPSSTDLADSEAERTAGLVPQVHHTTAAADLTSHDPNMHGLFSSTQLHLAVEAQDDSEDFNLANAYAYQNQSLGAQMINNSLKRGDDDENRILSPMEYLLNLDRDSSQLKSSQQLKALRDTLPRCTAEELSSLTTGLSCAPTAVYYRTSVERSLCKVQLAANYLVVVPFDSGTVGEFCGMMSEDYDGCCSILDTDQCSFNKRIPLNSLTAPFIIQFGEINNLVNNVVR